MVSGEADWVQAAEARGGGSSEQGGDDDLEVQSGSNQQGRTTEGGAEVLKR